MEPGHTLIDLGAAAHAVLSQNFAEHLEHPAAADPSALDQADDHPHVLDHQPIPSVAAPAGAAVAAGRPLTPRGSRPLAGGRRGAVLAGPALVEVALLALALGVAVVSGAPLRGGPLAMGLPAAEGTAQVWRPALRGWVRKKIPQCRHRVRHPRR